VRAFLPAYRLEAARDLKDVLDRLSCEPGRWKLFAGGTDLMVLLEAGKLPHHNFLSIWNLPELRGIEVTPDRVTVGAATTYTELRDHETLQGEFPLLVQAASETGAIATQNRGTIGGNIANGSPAADSPPALLVYDAEIELLSARGSRRRPFQGFHSGYKQMDLRPDELVGRIRLPRVQQPWREQYRKVGTRKAQAISKVCFAARALLEDDRIADIRLAFSSVAPIVLRATKTERTLRGKEVTPQIARAAAEQLAQEISPIDDMRSTANYRSRIAQSLLTQFLKTLSSQ
jgi:CO/xanthine dehydrogenase FAD-binding subunit